MTLSGWLNEERVIERMVAADMRDGCAALAAPCFVAAASKLKSIGIDTGTPVIACWVPGRIEVLGKHTDYCGGESLLAAAERGFCMIAAPRTDRTIYIHDARDNEAFEFPFDKDLQPRVGHWSNYPQTVARRLARNFPNATRGATMAFSSNLPASSGMSSSSAFVIGTFLLLAGINGLTGEHAYSSRIRTREDLAGYISTVENGLSYGPFEGDRGVGTFGGSEDHTAILCGQTGKLVLYSFCPVRYRRSIALAERYMFAIASSGVVAEKTGSALAKYNRIAAMVAAIVEQWQLVTSRGDSSLAAILASAPDAEQRLRSILSSARESPDAAFSERDLTERLDQFVIESQLIDSLPERIDATTIEVFGALAKKSHAAADCLLKNQTRETNRLAELATELGARAASPFGAGFGGSVWALIDAGSEAEFPARWRERYLRQFPERGGEAAFFLMRPGVAVRTWDVEADLAKPQADY